MKALESLRYSGFLRHQHLGKPRSFQEREVEAALSKPEISAEEREAALSLSGEEAFLRRARYLSCISLRLTTAQLACLSQKHFWPSDGASVCTIAQ